MGLPPIPDTLHLGCSCHLHSSRRFLSTWGVVMLKKIFILAEGLKIEAFFALSGEESSWVQTFCQSCVHLDFVHSSVHMTQQFVIQGCPTLKQLQWNWRIKPKLT